MSVKIFHIRVKEILCQTVNVQPDNVCSERWCQNMFPKQFYSIFIHDRMTDETWDMICSRHFFQQLQLLINSQIFEDNFVQCISLLLKYAALIYINNKYSVKDPFHFLTWFDPDDVCNALLWEKEENVDQTMFALMETLKMDRIVTSTVLSHIHTCSFETLPKCKNLIYYWQILKKKRSEKPIKVITKAGILEHEAIKLRQIFEHIRISRSVLDEIDGSHSYSAIIRGDKMPFKNSEFTTNYNNKTGHKTIYIPVNDNSSPYMGLILFDSKKSKTFEIDYLNSLILYSLAKNTEFVFVDSLIFHHDLILSSGIGIYDPLSLLLNPLTKNEKCLDDYFLVTDRLNELIKWSSISVTTSEKYDSLRKSNKKMKGIESVPNDNACEILGSVTEDDYERCSTDFAVAVNDSLLFHYQAGDIDFKFDQLREKSTTLSAKPIL